MATGAAAPSSADASSSAATTRRPSLLGVGTVVWLASELMFFAGLFAAYFTLRSGASTWPPEGVHLATVRTGIATVLLVASSFTAHGAVAAAERSDRRGAARWLIVTMGLGTVFLVNQVLEYAELEFSLSTDAYGSIFYLMTGFHGLHVLGGVLLFGAMIGAVSGRSSRAPTGEVVNASVYYWHFVDVVWVAMFATIYLLR
ncbi:heme-copper oxidase subunit III [soil metagenome]